MYVLIMWVYTVVLLCVCLSSSVKYGIDYVGVHSCIAVCLSNQLSMYVLIMWVYTVVLLCVCLSSSVKYGIDYVGVHSCIAVCLSNQLR